MPSTTLAAVAAVTGLLYLAKNANAKCDGLGAPDISFASSSNRMYIDAGCATVADLVAYRSDGNGKQKGPIWHFDPVTNWYSDVYTGTYYLESSIHIRNGATLSIDGAEAEVDECETLLLASNSTTYQNVRAHGGNLDIRYTKIFSWDLLAADYDTNTGDGRSYLSAVTEKLTGRDEDQCPSDPRRNEEGYSTGRAKDDMGDARMDIRSSEIAYLGYDASESYGISYKARGLCNDLTNLDIYDDDNGLDYGVKGDIRKSDIHHNWFGHYSWGHDGGIWSYNEVHDNYGYGFDPHDDSDNVQIIGNTVYNNGWHGIIASKRCTDITIRKNTVYNNGKNGIMLHRSCDRAYVRDNHSYGNVDAGLALYESSDCKVLLNTFENNKHGVRWSNGANRNRVYKNTIRVGSDENARFAFYMYRGSDEVEAEGNVDGHPMENVVYKNNIYSERDEVWKMEQSDYNNFWLNVFHSGLYARFEESIENKVHKNTYPEGWYYDTDMATCFKTVQEPVCE